MANVYKKTIVVTDPKTGQKVKRKSHKWWGRYRDENGVERRAALATDKTAAQAMLVQRVQKAERKAAGLVDRFDEHRKRPIAEHLADFEKHHTAKQVTAEQVKLVAMRVRRIIEHCKARFTNDLSASKVQVFLADLRKDGRSIQTSNHYLRAIKQFTRWLALTVHDQASALAYLRPMPSFDQAKPNALALRATGTDGPKRVATDGPNEVPTVGPRGAKTDAIVPAPAMCEPASDCSKHDNRGAEYRPSENAESPGKSGASCVASHRVTSICQAEREGVRSHLIPPARILLQRKEFRR